MIKELAIPRFDVSYDSTNTTIYTTDKIDNLHLSLIIYHDTGEKILRVRNTNGVIAEIDMSNIIGD